MLRFFVDSTVNVLRRLRRLVQSMTAATAPVDRRDALVEMALR